MRGRLHSMSKNHVIASQCAHWRGNPPGFQNIFFLKSRVLTSF